MPEPVPQWCASLPAGLAAIGAEARADWRADEAMWTAAAAQRWAHARGIDDVVREYAARGDRVRVSVAEHTFDGTVTAVGDDRIDVATRSGPVSIHTAMAGVRRALRAPLTIQRSRLARSGGWRLPTAPVTFRARLLELEHPSRRVRLGVFLSGSEYVGPIVVGDDHVVVAGDADLVVPSAWVAYVAPDSEDGT